MMSLARRGVSQNFETNPYSSVLRLVFGPCVLSIERDEKERGAEPVPFVLASMSVSDVKSRSG